MLFYVTPIVYSLHFLEAKLPAEWTWAKFLIQLNPLTGITDMYRAGFISQYGPDWHAWIYALIVSLAWLAFGSWVFRKLEPAILKEI